MVVYQIRHSGRRSRHNFRCHRGSSYNTSRAILKRLLSACAGSRRRVAAGALAYLYSYKYFEWELVDSSWYANNGFPDSARAATLVIAAAGAISGAPSRAALFAPFGGIATRPQAVHNN